MHLHSFTISTTVKAIVRDELKISPIDPYNLSTSSLNNINNMPVSPKIYHGNSTPRPDAELAALIDAHPKPSSLSEYSYGTAGFRYEASLLPCVFVRMGIFAALRSASLGGVSLTHKMSVYVLLLLSFVVLLQYLFIPISISGLIQCFLILSIVCMNNQEEVGAMITASHNAEPDNGMKLADSHGGMLDAAWEEHAVSLANAPDSQHALSLIHSLLSQHTPSDGGNNSKKKLLKMVVHIGRDTRSHSLPLASLVIRAARAMGATVIDHGEVTTPQLHHFVMHANGHMLPSIIPQRCNESGYYEIMALSYAALLRTGSVRGGHLGKQRLHSTSTLVIDGACGIGALKINQFHHIFEKLRAEGCTVGLPTLHTVNFPGDGPLNDKCGAEFVQKQQLPPRLYTPSSKGAVSKRYMASFDGDADRIVFHFEDEAGKFHLLDGDKIAVLVSSFIQDELRCIDPEGKAVKCGVVQTAYANGSSTLYLKVRESGSLVLALHDTFPPHIKGSFMTVNENRVSCDEKERCQNKCRYCKDRGQVCACRRPSPL